MMKKTLSYTTAFGVGFVMCAFALKALYGFEPSGLLPGSQSQSKQAVLAVLNTPPEPLKRTPGDSVVADAAAKVEPAVVDVHTVGKAVEAQNPFGNDPFFRQFFGGQPQQQQEMRPRGAGSGIIISSDGYILTNNHVVENTEQVTVTVNGKGYVAKVVGTDPVTDIAVCKIDTHGVKLPVAELGDSDSVRIGDWALAIGNPLDIGTTVTLGIISAKNRNNLSAEGHSLNSVIQTDAAINPGNSGGALANINGQVIGINEAIYSPTGSYVGIGFAIPINSAKKIAAQLIQDGRIIRPYLGVAYEPLKMLSTEDRRQIGIDIKGDEGAIVTQVYPGSPAEAAGLQQYDVVMEANRQKITDAQDLNSIIQKLKVGDKLVLLVSRNGQQQLISVTLKERPNDFGERQQQQPQQQPQPDQGNPFGGQ
jgi:Do/DeqQ family serine protease